jgi:aspartyl-tRNA(Asn)/glutamyl-tRNA(Gln) amidotransferase subunit B
MKQAVGDKYVAVIGLEVHCQLLTRSKIYSSDSTSFGNAPNTNISAITLAHPGTLPKLNTKVIELAIRMGLACHSEISRWNIFDRKNYFYPDLPKGYQLTQDRTPICKGGFITIDSTKGEKRITLNRIHIEEDAGKSLHSSESEDSFVDLNRAGVPLIEIVTEPCLQSSEDAGALMTEIRKIVRYLDICDGNMEEGSMRCDANVSIMLKGASEFGKKVEIKNMNSIRNVQKAIDHEIERQIDLLERGESVVSETRTFDVGTGLSNSMRTKEELNDYRYFPDPDLSPLAVSKEWLNEISSSMPELPRQLIERFVEQFGIPEYDARVLTDSRETAVYFQQVCACTNNFKAASNWVMGPVKSSLNESNSSAANFSISPQTLAELISLIDEGKLSYTIASQRVFPALLMNGGGSPLEIARELNLLQESNANVLAPIIDEIIKEFPLKVEEYKNGKKGIVTMFMGEVMKRSKGKADPKLASELLNKKLAEV